jgi:hypothetical protein
MYGCTQSLHKYRNVKCKISNKTAEKKKKKKYHTLGTILKIKYQYCRKMIIKYVLDACAQEKLEAK